MTFLYQEAMDVEVCTNKLGVCVWVCGVGVGGWVGNLLRLGC